MGYRFNIGCFWPLLILLLLVSTPLGNLVLVGAMRLLIVFMLAALLASMALSWWIRRNAVLRYTRTRGPETRRFVELLVGVLVRLAQVDGELDRREVTTIREFFQHSLGYDGEKLLWVRDLIKAARGDETPIEQLCGELRDGYAIQERFVILQVLARVAASDGAVKPTEQAFIERVADLLGIAPFAGAFGFGGGGGAAGPAGPRTSEVDDALSVLGLGREADPEEIKRAWRDLSMQNHPDRAAHLGDEFRQLAEERMRQINSAYQTLKSAGLAEG